ncbi:MAG: hypothetical protein ACE5K4_11860 [Candidatus Hydrothermarchaeota archaeon]
MEALVGIGGLGLIFFIIFLIVTAIRKKPKKAPLIGIVVSFVLIVIGATLSNQGNKEPTGAPKSTAVSPMAKEWELIESFGAVRTVYMSPTGLKDKYFIAQVLRKLVDRKKPVQVMFFDNKKYTPRELPMMDDQMLHWKAQYNFNPNTDFEKFIYIEITDPNSSPPGVKAVEANIRPGYAE